MVDLMKNENLLTSQNDRCLRMKGKIQSYDIFDGEILHKMKKMRDMIRVDDLEERENR